MDENKSNERKRALIVFGKLPGSGGKSRIKCLDAEEKYNLTSSLFSDTVNLGLNSNADFFLFITPYEKAHKSLEYVPADRMFPQKGRDLGERMFNSIEKVKNLGYDGVILIGTDIPYITNEIIEDAFEVLEENDSVLGKTDDGGYWLIGLKKPYKEIFDMEYSTPKVASETVKRFEDLNLSFGFTQTLKDIDTDDDFIELKRFTERILSENKGIIQDSYPYRNTLEFIKNRKR